jgi:HK97 gp10 family phage protein
LVEKTVEIKGLDKLINRLGRMPDNVALQIETTSERIGDAMMVTAFGLCPVSLTGSEGGGHLRESLNMKIDEVDGGMEITVGTPVHYAPHVEFGTGDRGLATGALDYPTSPEGGYTAGWPGMEAQPFLRPALYDNLEEIEKAIMEGIMNGLLQG